MNIYEYQYPNIQYAIIANSILIDIHHIHIDIVKLV